MKKSNMRVYKKSLVNIPMYKLSKILNQQSRKLLIPINSMSSSKKLSKIKDETHKLKKLKWQANHQLYPLLEESTSKLQREIVRVLYHRHVHTRHERPEEVDLVDDPNNCKYHRLISHPLNKCFVFKDRIMQLNKERKIEFEEKHKPKQFIQNVDAPKHKPKQFIQNDDALKHELKLFNPNNDAPKHELK
ncbi:hypothetical protein ERO13_D01G147750v2 [Gossypium hirsutum]|nr:hypothetical protein ERO13_D01G147750v2 [Gossypium hirsutum]